MSEHPPLESSDVWTAFEDIISFRRRYGSDSFLLACHAAVLERISVEILALIRCNFLSGAASFQPSHDADVLFSTLCHDLGSGFFRMETEVRRQLLVILDTHGRLRGMTDYLSARVGRFIRHYVAFAQAHESKSKTRRFRQYLNENLWTALAIDDPDAAAAALFGQIEARLDHSIEAPNAIRLGGLASLLTLPLRSMLDEIAYALAQDKLLDGNIDEARTLLEPLAGRSFEHEGIVLPSPETTLSQYDEYVQRRIGLVEVSNKKGDVDPAQSQHNDNLEPRLRPAKDREITTDRPLHDAVRSNDIEKVHVLLETIGDDIDAPGARGRTALHIAASLEHDAIANLLLEAGANPTRYDVVKNTPLHVACFYGRASLVDKFLAIGVTPDLRTADGVTPIMLAAYFGYEKIVKRLLDTHAIGSGHINAATDVGYLAINGPMSLGNAVILEMLIEAGAKIPEPESGISSLFHSAAIGGHPKIIGLILRSGYPVDLLDAMGWAALHITAQYDKAEAAILLLETGAEIDRPTKDGWTAVMIAASWGTVNVLRVLVRYGADLSLSNSFGNPPLLIAAVNGKSAAVCLLLLSNHVKPHVRNIQGDGVLELAIDSGDKETVLAVLSHRVFANISDISLLERAIKAGNTEIVGILLDKTHIDPGDSSAKSPLAWQGLDAKKDKWKVTTRLLSDQRIETPTRNDGTPFLFDLLEDDATDALDVYVRRGDPLELANNDGQSALAQACEKNFGSAASQLINAGCNPNDASARDLLTPLLLAIRAQSETSIRVLIDHSVNLDVATPEGQGPLHLAAASTQAILSLLLPQIPELETRDSAGRTPLHIAAASGNVDTVQALLDAGAAIEALTDHDLTPLLVALHAGRQDVAEELLCRGADGKAETSTGWTTLHMAAQKNLGGIVTTFVAFFRDLNLVAMSPQLTPLQAAAEADAMESARALIEAGASIDMGTLSAPSPLMIAVRSGFFELANVLVERGARDDILDPQSGASLTEVFEARRTFSADSGQDQKEFEAKLFNKDAKTDQTKRHEPEAMTLDNRATKLRGNNAAQGLLAPLADPEFARTTWTDVPDIISRTGILVAGLSRDEKDVPPPWTPADPAVRARVIYATKDLPNNYLISETSAQIMMMPLPFYPTAHLVRVQDPQFKQKRLALFFVYMRGSLVWLDGTTRPIHKLNEMLQVYLTNDNLLSYLRFYAFFWRSKDGPLYICDTASDEALDSIEGLQINEFARVIRPAKLEGLNENRDFLCTATVIYSNAVFRAIFRVTRDGAVNLSQDESLAYHLPAKVDIPVA